MRRSRSSGLSGGLSGGTGILPVIAFALAISGVALSGCVTFEDRCVDVRCGEGEICVDREPAPTCVCDDAHEADDDGVCVPIEDEDGSGL